MLKNYGQAAATLVRGLGAQVWDDDVVFLCERRGHIFPAVVVLRVTMKQDQWCPFARAVDR